MKSPKITKRDRADAGRRYDDACGAAHGLDVLGERWALLVVRELMLGPKRFSDLRADLPGISANVLTQRLEGLERSGIVAHRRLPPPAAGQAYALTDWGHEAEPILRELGRWAARSPQHDPTRPLSAVSLFLSFRTLFDPTRAAGETARLGFRIGRETFLLRVTKDGVEVTRGTLEGAQAVLAGAAPAIAAVVYGGASLDGSVPDGGLIVEGDLSLVERFVTWFVLPPKAD